jgi:SpoVK/Ycf46/Vps4 family AAA+-type ATPase
MDGFDSLGRTKLIMATNRPDTLDPALLRPGRLDRKIEIPLPNEQGRLEILKIHAKGINKSGDIDYEAVVKLSDGFNGADLRNVCTEAGMFAIRDDRWTGMLTWNDRLLTSQGRDRAGGFNESGEEAERRKKARDEHVSSPSCDDEYSLTTVAGTTKRSRLHSIHADVFIHITASRFTAWRSGW